LAGSAELQRELKAAGRVESCRESCEPQGELKAAESTES